MPVMLDKRQHFQLVVFNDTLFALDGHNGVECLRSVEYYDKYDGVWKYVSRMCYARSMFGACAYNA